MCAHIDTSKTSVQRFQYTTQILQDMPSLSPHICQSMRKVFVKRPKYLSATSSLSVEQNLVHLDRFTHFSHITLPIDWSQLAHRLCPRLSPRLFWPSLLVEKQKRKQKLSTCLKCGNLRRGSYFRLIYLLSKNSFKHGQKLSP